MPIKKTRPETRESSELKLGGDFRMTRQRREVYEVLMAHRDHPTATEVFLRVKDRMPSISLATVYNCLETMAQCGVVRQVNVDREPSRYCGNMMEHGHFYCQSCGSVRDVDLRGPRKPDDYLMIHDGSIVEKMEVGARGLCPECAAKKAAK
jgi:Fe2+ or Zn2+ uptake regulation protein